MTDIKSVSRRSFLQRGLICVSAIPIAASVGYFSSLAFAEGPSVALNPEDPVAKGLGYVADATKVDLVKWPKKAAADGAKQRCGNCVLFKNGGQKIEGTEGEFGVCALFQQGLVNSNGWCNSWALNPAAPA
jgi:hypothetical protein